MAYTVDDNAATPADALPIYGAAAEIRRLKERDEARQAVEANLQSNINATTSNLQSNINATTSNLQSNIDAEATTRATSDGLLQNQIIGLTSDAISIVVADAIQVDSIPLLLVVDPTNNSSVRVLSYHTPTFGFNLQGGGDFIWDDSRPKADHNGCTVIDPNRPFPVYWNDAVAQGVWFTADNTGTGCWVRQYSGAIDITWAGAIGDGSTDNAKPILACLNLVGLTEGRVTAPAGTFVVKETLLFPSGVSLVGSGRRNATKIKAVHTGSAAISLKGAMHVSLHDILIETDLVTFPKTGIVLGRNSAASAGQHHIVNIRIQGYFSVAAIYSIASERNVWDNTYVWLLGGGAKYTFYTGASDTLAVESLVTSTNIGGTFINTDLINSSQDANAACIYMALSESMGDWNFYNPYLIPYVGSYIHMHNSSSAQAIGSFCFWGGGGERLGANGDPTFGLRITSNTYLNLRGLTALGMRFDFLAGASKEQLHIDSNVYLTTPNIVLPPPEAYPYASITYKPSQVASGGIVSVGRYGSWTDAALGTGWINNFGLPYEQAAYRVSADGQVQLKGLVTSGTTSTILTLPEGYRPKNNIICPVMLKSPALYKGYSVMMKSGMAVDYGQIVRDNNGGTGFYYRVLTPGTTNAQTVATDTGGATYALVNIYGVGRVLITAATGAITLIEGYVSGQTSNVTLSDIKFQAY